MANVIARPNSESATSEGPRHRAKRAVRNIASGRKTAQTSPSHPRERPMVRYHDSKMYCGCWELSGSPREPTVPRPRPIGCCLTSCQPVEIEFRWSSVDGLMSTPFVFCPLSVAEMDESEVTVLPTNRVPPLAE